jgi:hypothetical protein
MGLQRRRDPSEEGWKDPYGEAKVRSPLYLLGIAGNSLRLFSGTLDRIGGPDRGGCSSPRWLLFCIGSIVVEF